MATTIFQIEEGEFALAMVNTGALGYLATWQAPAGKTAETALLTDYDADADVWFQQVTSAQLVASPNDNDVTTPATFSQASIVTPQPGVTSYDLQVDFLQDINIAIGLSQFLFENDTGEAYFLLGTNAGDPPRAIGRVRIRAGAFAGPARENLTASVTLPLVRKPSISFGDGTTSVITGMASPEEVAAARALRAEAKKVAARGGGARKQSAARTRLREAEAMAAASATE